MADSRTETCDVVIIGGSMISMTMGILLREQGVSCISVEKHASTAIHPRSAIFQPRSVQIFERMGLYEDMKVEEAKIADDKVSIVDVDALAGNLIQKFTANANAGIEKISPVPRMFLSQKGAEPILKSHAVSTGVDVRFSTQMIDFVQEADGVVATMRNLESGVEYKVKAKFLIGCDGYRSMIRKELQIEVDTYGIISHCVTIYFKADLLRYIEGRWNGVIYVNNEKVRGVWRLDKTGKNGFMFVCFAGPRGSEESKHVGDTITHEKALQYFYEALGVDNEPVEITGIDTWDAVFDIAMEWKKDRVFLIGDAAHVNPPHGGFGGNTGIQDASNLGWKLGLVLKGKAGPSLLETYEKERFTVAQKIVNQVFCRFVTRSAPELREKKLEREEEQPEPWLELGYKYLNSDIIIYDGSSHDDLVENPETAEARPGCMTHHVHVTPLDEEHLTGEVSLLKVLSNKNFVLLLGEDATEWKEGVERLLAETPDEPLEFHRVQGDKFLTKYGIKRSGTSLIRPDMFVAWRSPERPQGGADQALKILKDVMNRVLYRT